MDSSFFRDLGGGRYLATGACTGPWDPSATHGGPPCALVAREVERQASWPGTVARLTCEILGPVPVGELQVQARLVRGGRSVELIEVTLSDTARAVLSARAWRIRAPEDPAAAPEGAVTDPPAPPSPPAPRSQRALPPLPSPPRPPRADGGPASPQLAGEWEGGYLSAMEWDFVDGHFATPGPATAWARPRIALVDGEPVSPLQRMMLLADCGNGLSSELDLRRWLFINPELTVHVTRYPVGEWLCLQAESTLSPGQGTGLAASLLWDTEGCVGRGAQALLVAARGRSA